MKTPEDGDKPDTGLGQKIPPKPAPPDDERHWKPLANHPGYQQHEITHEVRETPRAV